MLTDAAIKALKPRDKVYKVTDRDGMYLLVSPTGAMTFRFDYRLNGRRETVCQSALNRDPRSAPKRDPFSGARFVPLWA